MIMSLIHDFHNYQFIIDNLKKNQKLILLQKAIDYKMGLFVPIFNNERLITSKNYWFMLH